MSNPTIWKYNYPDRSITAEDLADGAKPYITVSAEGVSNGLSDLINDGADFGPDTMLNATNPSQIGSPYTQTSGIQEAGNYVNSIGGGIVFLKQGLFLINTNINGSNWNGVSIIGSGSTITTAVMNAFGYGTTIAPSNNWNPSYTLTNFPLPTVGYYNYSPLIYVIGTGANGNYPNPAGTNLEFKNFLISGINTLNGSPFPNTMGLYMHGVWNLVVDHVDTQQLWWGKYFDINGPSGGSNWYLNSTEMGPFDVGTYWEADVGAMTNIEVESMTFGHVHTLNNNFSIYAYIITGANTSVSTFASNLSYLNSSLLLESYASVTNVMCNNINVTTPAVMINGSNSVLSGFYIFSNGQNAPIFTFASPNSSGGAYTNVIISDGVIAPSNNSSYPSTFLTGTVNVNKIVGNEILFSDITLYTGSNAYWASPIISTSANSGYVNPVKFKNVQGLSLYYTPTLSANPPVSGTVYQNLTFQDIVIYLPVYASTSGTNGSMAVALDTTSTPSTIYTKFVSGATSSTAADMVILNVPAGWYYSFTGAGVTFGTATIEAI